ncbi:hypothetical protein GCM10010372_30840 [Streptomyces tauricus]|uniref:hypothetical protein n=1 Tax=Streptomyces tauricus TaxID=68274 RepID=UPI00167944BF|nr:hypothetical protein [Streptomyces tauricus]GHA28821.1 hypothetical protein GCM10010372_30840 [Streptomyces tauricus]
MTGRLHVFLDGEWQEIEGVVSVELDEEMPDEAYWRRHDALDALAFSMPQLSGTFETTVITVCTDRYDEAFDRVRRAMQGLSEPRPRVIDQDGNPVRPAWQSPYGPPRRRS